ncbi:MAG: DoxX family protein [Ignavibacteriae bacterium]|nr:MAG: DoxX family protein [Ignavibacteriota bacterium]
MKINIDAGLLILRVTIGLLMLLHGIAKLSGVSGIEGMLTFNGLPAFLAYGVFITEIIAPIVLIIGYRTRLAAIVFALGTLAAMFLAHSAEIFTLSKYGGWAVDLLGLYFFGALVLLFTGGGKFALSKSDKWD